jgi:hypothetical protein
LSVSLCVFVRHFQSFLEAVIHRHAHIHRMGQICATMRSMLLPRGSGVQLDNEPLTGQVAALNDEAVTLATGGWIWRGEELIAGIGQSWLD